MWNKLKNFFKKEPPPPREIPKSYLMQFAFAYVKSERVEQEIVDRIAQLGPIFEGDEVVIRFKLVINTGESNADQNPSDH